ncbi:hypothetical protein ACWU4S_004178 [Yersinia enterocolitica]|uniref:hypothetical protein n=1 Tax=Yersinia mollaretii TaxID=33060 RepID=UPI000C1EB1D7|nr:hypothetical protein [Yersinia mollaretii]PJE88711.1 hypothetical protein CU280_06305 [Yersinia mollaretii]
MESIFLSRPFKTRNADEFDISSVLNLFVNPISGLITPFDYENTIIKGKMGSGKTMFLRANYAYYISCLVPAIMEKNDELVLPILIKLSDFQHIDETQEIYRQVIIKIIEELTSIYMQLENTTSLLEIHENIKKLPQNITKLKKLNASMKHLAQLESEEYIERVSTDFGLKGGVKPKFFELSSEWKKTNFSELKKKINPGIKDIEECYNNLLSDSKGKILLLIDEAGSLDSDFFKNENGESCLFEIMMNQFRTTSFIRTKIAIYPNSYSDILAETRYGDVILLEDSIHEEVGFRNLRKKSINIINNYINQKSVCDFPFKANDIFEISENDIYGDSLEQIIYASNGNMRRLIHLFDLSMDMAFSEKGFAVRVEKKHVLDALIKHATNNETLLSSKEKETLNDLVAVCKARSAFKFNFPNVPLYRFTGKSREYNIIKIEQVGTGRSPTTYSFDFSYCVYKDIPTHRMENSEKINKERSGNSARWIARVASINQELITQAGLPGKIEGNVTYYNSDKGNGFITSDSNEQFFFQKTDIINTDKNKSIQIGKRLRFYPNPVGDTNHAEMVEIL